MEKEKQLLSKLINGGETNLYKWVEQIVVDFCEEEAVQ